MKDIADDLQLSVVTVSKILRNKGRFRAETRERVLRRAREMDYRANWIARSLAMRRTFTIGLLLPDFTHSFFAEIAKAIADTVRPHGYHVIISYFEEDPQLEKSEAEALIDRQVDGLVIASAQPSADTQLFERARKRNLPVVLIDRPLIGADASFVGVDNQEIGRLAAEHLVAKGCRRIAILRGPAVRIGDQRTTGARRALQEKGLDVPESCILTAGYTDESGFQAMQKLLGTGPAPDGVICFNDPVAIGAIKAILAVGLKVPEDVAVVGAGNIHYSDLLAVPLTTIDQKASQTGKDAAALLLAQIGAKRRSETKTILIAPQLVERESSRRFQ